MMRTISAIAPRASLAAAASLGRKSSRTSSATTVAARTSTGHSTVFQCWCTLSTLSSPSASPEPFAINLMLALIRGDTPRKPSKIKLLNQGRPRPGQPRLTQPGGPGSHRPARHCGGRSADVHDVAGADRMKAVGRAHHQLTDAVDVGGAPGQDAPTGQLDPDLLAYRCPVLQGFGAQAARRRVARPRP